MTARRTAGERRERTNPGTAAAAPILAPPRSGSGWRLAAVLALIVAIGLYAYAGSFEGLFVLDEKSAIIDNPNIRSLRTSFTAPPEVGLGGRPVVSLTFALNYALAPADAREAFTPPPPGYPPEAAVMLYRNLWGYHATNLAIHILTALAIFGIARRTLNGDRLRAVFAGAPVWLAFTMAAIWVAHPLNTGSVTYVAQRVESLMGLFYAATVYFSIRAWGSSRAGFWSAAAIASCALGMGTKEITVTAPIVVVLYDWVFLSREAGGASALWRRRKRLYAGLAATWVLLAVFVASAPRGASVGFFLEGWTPWRYLVTQAGVIAYYLRLVFVPWPLVLDYEWPAAASPVSVLPQAVLVASLFALTVWGLVRRAPAAWLGAVFFLVLAPSSSVLPIVTEVAAEHRMYLPLAAVIAGIVIGGFVLGRSLIRSQKARAAAAIVAVVALTGALGAATRDRNRVYWSAESLWADTVAKRPGDSRAKVAYAEALADAGRLPEAQTQLETAIGIEPDDPAAHVRLAVVLARQGRFGQALPHAERALALRPDDPDARRLVSQLQRAGGGIR